MAIMPTAKPWQNWYEINQEARCWDIFSDRLELHITSNPSKSYSILYPYLKPWKEPWKTWVTQAYNYTLHVTIYHVTQSWTFWVNNAIDSKYASLHRNFNPGIIYITFCERKCRWMLWPDTSLGFPLWVNRSTVHLPTYNHESTKFK